jgi:hypothetical protein
MNDVLERGSQVFAAHWGSILLGLTWLGIALVVLLGWRRRKRRRLVRQVTFSLNYVRDGALCLRTLLEDAAHRVWLNAYALDLVCAAAAETTTADPFLHLRSGRHMEFVKRAVVNALSARGASAYVAESLGAGAVTRPFVFAITFERYASPATAKLRVILVEKRQLEALFDRAGGAAALRVADETHRDRVRTLERMWEMTTSHRGKSRRALGEVELGVPLPLPASPDATDRAGGHGQEAPADPPAIALEPQKSAAPEPMPDGE